jgi:hypothetical protein
MLSLGMFGRAFALVKMQNYLHGKLKSSVLLGIENSCCLDHQMRGQARRWTELGYAVS